MRRHRADAEYVRLRRSVSYPARATEARAEMREYFTHLYPRMLIEDVSHQVTPLGLRTTRVGFEAGVVPRNEAVSDLVAAALSRHGQGFDLAEAIHDFFSQCSGLLMTYGEAVYESVPVIRKADEQLAAFELEPIPWGTYTRRRGGLVQRVDPEVAQDLGVPETIEVPEADIVSFDLPSYVARGHRRMMEALTRLSDPVLPGFALKSDPLDPKRVPLDSTAHIRSRLVAVAAATRHIGWNARGLFDREITEYYQLHRFLAFERFKVELRESILSTLNQWLERVGGRMGFQARIELRGLSTREDCQAVERDLQSGGRPFKEVVDAFRVPGTTPNESEDA